MLTTRSVRVRQILEHSRSAREAEARSRAWKVGQEQAPATQRPAWEVLEDGSWRGQRCFIIGGGPSLKGFNFERLRGERVIAINKAYVNAPFADVVFAMDRPLLDLIASGKLGGHCRRAFEEFLGVKLWLDLSGYTYPRGVYSVPAAGEIGWTTSLHQGLYHGQNSGYGALNLALVLGADPIYLLGYDMALGPAGEKHYHDGYPTGTNPEALNTFLKTFHAGAELLKAGPHPRIVNLNPNSALKDFESGNLADIKDLGRRRSTGGQGYVVVSFYTEGTSYAKEVRNLVASLEKFKLAHHIFSFPPRKDWRDNLNYKSGCILKAFDMFPGRDIVFLDADAIVRRPPTLFDELSARHNYDLSACFFKYDPRSGDADELLSGTLWIQNNDVGRALVAKWHEIGLAQPLTRHQMCLKAAVAELQKAGTKVRVFRHPFAYTCVFDYQLAHSTTPVIEHYQASRRFRKEVGYGAKLIPGGTA